MKPFDDMLPEEQDPQFEELITLLVTLEFEFGIGGESAGRTE